MRFPIRYCQYIAILVAVLVLCSCSGCSRKNTQGIKPPVTVTPGKSASAQAQPVRVVLYGWGLGTGRVEVNMRDRELGAVTGQLWHGSNIGLGALQSMITAEEASQLRQVIANSGLRSFHPTLAWWEEAAKKPEYEKPGPGYWSDWQSPSILIAWSDKQTVYRIPLPPLRLCMRAEAQKGYDALDSVAVAVGALERKYAKLSKPRAATKDELGKLDRELDVARKEALPK